jgi:hypothetical protein
MRPRENLAPDTDSTAETASPVRSHRPLDRSRSARARHQLSAETPCSCGRSSTCAEALPQASHHTPPKRRKMRTRSPLSPTNLPSHSPSDPASKEGGRRTRSAVITGKETRAGEFKENRLPNHPQRLDNLATWPESHINGKHHHYQASHHAYPEGKELEPQLQPKLPPGPWYAYARCQANATAR